MEKSHRQSEEERLLTQVTNVMSKHDIDEEEIARILLTKNSGGGPESLLAKKQSPNLSGNNILLLNKTYQQLENETSFMDKKYTPTYSPRSNISIHNDSVEKAAQDIQKRRRSCNPRQWLIKQVFLP